MSDNGDNGVALVIVMMTITLLTALGMALTLATIAETAIAANYRDATEALYAAEAAVEFATQEVAAVSDWSGVISAPGRSAFVDGPAGGLRTVGAATLDLSDATRDVNLTAAGAPGTAGRSWGVVRLRSLPGPCTVEYESLTDLRDGVGRRPVGNAGRRAVWSRRPVDSWPGLWGARESPDGWNDRCERGRLNDAYAILARVAVALRRLSLVPSRLDKDVWVTLTTASGGRRIVQMKSLAIRSTAGAIVLFWAAAVSAQSLARRGAAGRSAPEDDSGASGKVYTNETLRPAPGLDRSGI